MSNEKRCSEPMISALSVNQLDAVVGGAGGSVISQGSFQSNTGTPLNIQVNWRAVSGGAAGKTLEVDVSAVSYKLYTSADYNGVQLTVNGAVYSSGSQAIEYGGSGVATSPLASFSVPNVSGSVQLSVVWHFNGSYSGVSLQDVRAAAAVYI